MNWREESQRRDSRHEFTTKPIRQSHRKPPSGLWQPSVPLWEKQFCSSMSIPWRKLCETKKVMCLYSNVVQWNDSAGEESFFNAKKRFWAKINGFPCDVSLPDPDIYIDKIDWNSSIDPDLLLDLDQETVVHDDEKDGKFGLMGSGLDSLCMKNWANDDTLQCTGWGDSSDAVKPVAVENNWGKNEDNSWSSRDWKNVHDETWNHSGWESGEANSWDQKDWGNADNNPGRDWRNADNGNSWNRGGWEEGKFKQRDRRGWDNGEDNSWNQRDWGGVDDNSWNQRGWGTGGDNSGNHTGWQNSNDNLWRHSDWGNGNDSSWKQRDGENGGDNSCTCRKWEHETNEPQVSTLKKNGGVCQAGKGNCRKRDGVGRFGSSYSNSRHQSTEEYRINDGWRNCRGRKRTDFGHERPVFDGRALVPGQWN